MSRIYRTQENKVRNKGAPVAQHWCKVQKEITQIRNVTTLETISQIFPLR